MAPPVPKLSTYRVTREIPKVDNEVMDGLVNHTERIIKIHPDLEGREFVGVVIHEIIHAICPDLAEHAVLSLEHGILEGIDPYVEYK